MEREALQYDVRFDSQRFSALIAQNASEQVIEKQKGYIDDGIQALRKKLCELSGKPDVIRTVPGRKTKYVLTY